MLFEFLAHTGHLRMGVHVLVHCFVYMLRRPVQPYLHFCEVCSIIEQLHTNEQAGQDEKG